MATETALKESREDVFNRLAVARTTRALKSIRVMENLKNYPHNAKKSAQIITALKVAVEKLEYALGGEKEAKASDEFTFEEEE